MTEPQPFKKGKADLAKQTDREPKGQTKVSAGKKGAGKADEAKDKNPTPRTTNPRKRSAS